RARGPRFGPEESSAPKVRLSAILTHRRGRTVSSCEERVEIVAVHRRQKGYAADCANQLSFVQDFLCNLPLTDLAPLPTARPDRLVKVFLGDPDRPKPNFGFGVAHFFKLGAAGEVEKVRPGFDRAPLDVGLRDGAVENVSGGFETRLAEIIGGL